MDDGRYDPGILTAGISEDGKDIILQATGSDWELKKIADSLRHLTALPRSYKNKHHGLMHIPLTWALVTQCAKIAQQKDFKWKPEPDLAAWVVEEFGRRFTEYKDTSDLKFDVDSLDWEPMPHQLSGMFTGAMAKRFFFADDMGTGKTRTALLTLAELEVRGEDPFPCFVVAPASVVDPWLEELEATFPDWTFTAYRGPRRKKLSSRYQVYVMSWDVFRQDMQPPDLAQCERCELTVEWSKAQQKAYDVFTLGGVGVKDEHRKLVLHHGCPKILPSKGYSVFRPIDSSKHTLPPLLDFLVPRTIIADEAHALCNVKTKQSIAIGKIARVTKYLFPMSGTPITNDIRGFWRAHGVIDTLSFPDQERYAERYADRYKKDYGQPEVEGLTTIHRDEFYVLMQGTMRRVSKKDVLKDLPDKTYSTRVVTIPPAYRKAYDEMEEDMIAHIPDTDEPLPVMNTLAQLQRLSQLASSACDVEIEYILDENPESLTFNEEVPHYKVTMREPCWKVDELMAVMSENEGSPLVTFAPHAQLMEIAGTRAESKGYKVGYIKGGQSHTLRSKTRLSFQNNELDLLCVTTSAGGVGLTLTAAHTAVFLEPGWEYWRRAQAEDRLHRRGQTAQVHIIDVIASNTVETRMRQAIRDKAKNLGELVRDPHIFREVLGGK